MHSLRVQLHSDNDDCKVSDIVTVHIGDYQRKSTETLCYLWITRLLSGEIRVRALIFPKDNNIYFMFISGKLPCEDL